MKKTTKKKTPKSAAKKKTTKKKTPVRDLVSTSQSIGGAMDLIWTMEAGDLAGTKRLLRGEIDVTVTDEGGDSLLHMASRHGWHKIGQILLDRGAEIDGAGFRGATPLHTAATFGRLKMVSFLVDAGADASALDIFENTPLYAICIGEMGASAREQRALVGRLCDAGCPINARGRSRRTALSYAASKGYFPLVRALLERGADATLLSGDGICLSEIASSEGHSKSAALLASAEHLAAGDRKKLAKKKAATKKTNRRRRIPPR